MTEQLDAHKVVDHVVTALNANDHDASQTMLQEVNADLRKLSEPERNLVANDLSLKGLLPDLALETGLVSEDTFVTKDTLAKVASEQGSASLQGMSAKFLADNFSALGGGVRQDINSDYVKGFDLRYDMALETAGAKREFSGLLDMLKMQNPDDPDIQSRDGLQAGDIDALLSKPDQLTADQTSALKTMKDHFEYMKTPRGIWTVTDWTEPRVTESSLDEFVDSGLPLGMRDQLKIAEQEKSKQADLETAAQQAQQERQAPPAVPADDTTKTDEPKVEPDVPTADPVQSETPKAEPEVPMVEPETPKVEPETPKVEPETPNAEPETPKAEPETPKAEPETPKAEPESPKVEPETPKVEPETPKAEPETPKAEPETPKAEPETPKVEPETPKVEPETPKVEPEAPKADPENPQPQPEVVPKPDAPLTPPEAPGDQTTPPESMERDKVTDKEIEVVKGDSLWKIARTHLTEKDGKSPSNADILNLVNKIVERNNIKTPDLIYPGQKFIIPGDPAPQTVAPETVTPTTPDTTTPGGTSPDTAVPDSTKPDTATDATTPDTVVPDTTTPDMSKPDATTPDTVVPDTTTPDTAKPDTTTPSSVLPDTTTPDTVTPEEVTPETATPPNYTED